MKRIRLITFSLIVIVFAFVLIACGNNNDATLEKMLNDLSVPTTVDKDFSLPSKVNEVSLTWESSKLDSISVGTAEGDVINFTVTRKNTDETVDLKVTANIDGKTKNKSFPVKVKAIEVTISFVSDKVTINNIVIPINTKAAEPSISEIEGFSFAGFFIDEDYKTPFSFDETVTKNTVLYLKFSADLTPQDLVDEAGKAIESLELELVNGKYNLPSKGLNNTNILWTSADPELISSNGSVIPNLIGKGESIAQLTASIRGPRGTTAYSVSKTVSIPEWTTSENVTSVRDITFENLTTEYNVANNTLRTYFVDNGNTPYVDIKDFLDLLGKGSIPEAELGENQINGFIHSDEIEYSLAGPILTMSYDVTYIDDSDPLNPTTETYTFSVAINFEKNTITSESFSFFSNYVKSTSTNYSLGISYLESYSEDGNPIAFALDNYRLNIFLHQENSENKYLMPFHLVNQIFTGDSYYNVYYNVDSYYGIYAVPSSGTNEFTKIKTSSANKTAVPTDINLFNYDMTVFVLDHYYGLKEERAIVTYYNVLSSYTNGFFGNAESSSTALFNLIYQGLDDLHTSPRFYGYYNDPSFTVALTAISQLGENVQQWYRVSSAIDGVIESRWGTDKLPPDYRIIDEGKTAVIYLDGFVTATSEDLLIDPNSFDTDIYFQETLDAIFEESNLIENIVVDLSNNTGGNLGALLRVLGYITDQPIQMSYQDPTEGSNLTYFAVIENYRYEKDADNNYVLDEEGNRKILTDADGNPIIVQPREDIKWFFLTSKVTFSAANLMTAIGKNQGFATIIGTTSGGGASSIVPVSLPNGSFFTMSSLNVLSIRIDNGNGTYTYESIEHGIEPDYELSVANTQNDNEIIRVIAQANA